MDKEMVKLVRMVDKKTVNYNDSSFFFLIFFAFTALSVVHFIFIPTAIIGFVFGVSFQFRGMKMKKMIDKEFGKLEYKIELKEAVK